MGKDLCFCVGGKMFAAVNLEPPHQLGFKCTPEVFGKLTARQGIIPAPYLARAMWVQESELGAALERNELETLLWSAYDLVVDKLPKSQRPGAAPRTRAQAKKARPKTRTKIRPTSSRR